MKYSVIAAACCVGFCALTLSVLVSPACGSPITSGLLGWYDAGDTDGDGIPDTLADDTVISTWVNKANPGPNDGVATATPSVANGLGDTLNGQPVIRFSGRDTDRDSFLLGTFRTDLGGFHAYVVSVSNETDGRSWQRLVASWNGTGSDWEGNNWIVMRPNLNNGAPQAYSARVTGASSTSAKVIQNVRIARSGTTEAEWFDGDIAEVILYERQLNSAEDILVQNYLSSRYDLAYGNDRYAGDTSAQGEYDLDVFGIGRVNSSNESTNGMGAGLAIAESGDTLGDGEWVLAGHKTGVNGWVADDIAGALRSDRVWYLDETGDVNVTLTFDLSDAGLSNWADEFMLLYSTTNAFAFTDLGLMPAVNGDQVSFNLTGGSLQDGYYTLAAVPEPSTLALAVLGLLGLGCFAGRQRHR